LPESFAEKEEESSVTYSITVASAAVSGSTGEKRGKKQYITCIQSNRKHDMTVCSARSVLTRYYMLPTKRETSGDVFSALDRFRTDEREGTVPCSAC
jgi:hypothetical protein